ncbi:hypothetical protein [Sphingomonas elodea]|uniref:hypothetical protein n=1 Tax=Sphingomonas elodea TaxID=179878 RepID=UPI0002D5C5B5|nr:hypothetical protein [Sphingomonas elodea]
MMEQVEPKPAVRGGFAAMLDRMENVYLAVLRAGALLIATLLLAYAAWLGVSGLYKVSRDVKSVKEAVASVSAEDVASVDLKAQEAKAKQAADPMRQQRSFYQGFAKRYLALYRSKFEPFQQPDDAKLTDQEFTSLFVDMDGRLTAIERGDLDFAQDKGDLEALLKAVTGAADLKVTKDRLQAYRRAKKVQVARTVTEMKTERYCSYYGYYIDSCISWSTREVPVSRTVTETRLPDGIVYPADLFRAYHQKFVDTLIERREANAAQAQKARVEIQQDNANGSERLWTAIRIVGAFVVLMFLFLLIALERHQRRIARADAGSGQG